MWSSRRPFQWDRRPTSSRTSTLTHSLLPSTLRPTPSTLPLQVFSVRDPCRLTGTVGLLVTGDRLASVFGPGVGFLPVPGTVPTLSLPHRCPPVLKSHPSSFHPSHHLKFSTDLLETGAKRGFSRYWTPGSLYLGSESSLPENSGGEGLQNTFRL